MLDAERWRQVDKIFHEALKRDPNEREVFLERECAGDASLRKEVETLIRSQGRRQFPGKSFTFYGH